MSTNRFIKISVRLAAVAAVAAPLALVGSAPALADVPTPPIATEFEAPACTGTTEFSEDYPIDPAANPFSQLSNLLRVLDGDPADARISRLEAYNMGAIVPLYDAYGMSDLSLTGDPGEEGATAAYPPICATRYVASEDGPISEWMFCSDYTSRSCADVDEDGFGKFVDSDYQPQDLATATMPTGSGNSRLNAGQQKLIAYLIQHGYPYFGVGGYDFDSGSVGSGEFANTDTTRSRISLQVLVWCVSDYGYYLGGDHSPDPDFDATCDASGLSPEGQAALIAAIPDNPVLTLAVSAPGSKVAPGSTVRVRVESNVFAQPLTVTSSLPVTVCSGMATLDGDQLSIAGTDASIPKVIELCTIAPESGEATIEVSVLPATTEHIGWNQASTGVDGELCQVYASFYRDQAVMLTGLSTLAVGEDAELAAAGAVVPWGLVLAALGLLGAGAVLSRRRTSTAR